MSGTPVSVIDTPYIEKLGLKAGRLSRWMLNHPRLKYLMRMFYLVRSLVQLKKAVKDKTGARDYWQAGKSVQGVEEIVPVEDVVKACANKLFNK